MKKLLLILLLVMMPFQVSWSAAASYCQHEQDSSTQHFGHHSHQHEAKYGKSDDVQKSGKVHTDCGYCHTVLQATSNLMETLPSNAPGASYLAARHFTFKSFIADGPRRPDRYPVA